MTPEEQAALMVADPGWDFADSPTSAISQASISAATAYGNGHLDQAKFWTEVGLRLVVAAGNPHVKVGASLAELAETLGVRV